MKQLIVGLAALGLVFGASIAVLKAQTMTRNVYDGGLYCRSGNPG